MTSNRQRVANRANSAKSTGSRSKAGKKSRRKFERAPAWPRNCGAERTGADAEIERVARDSRRGGTLRTDRICAADRRGATGLAAHPARAPNTGEADLDIVKLRSIGGVAQRDGVHGRGARDEGPRAESFIQRVEASTTGGVAGTSSTNADSSLAAKRISVPLKNFAISYEIQFRHALHKGR